MQITKKIIISNTLWSGVAHVAVMFINLLVLPLFIKNLGAELYGIWVISNIVLGYLYVFDFGFVAGIQRYVVKARVKGDHRELSEVVVSGTAMLWVMGLLIGGVCYLSAGLIVSFFNIHPENVVVAQRLIQISSLFSVVMWPLQIVNVVLNASMRIKELNFLVAAKTGIQSLAMLVMVYAAADIILIKWVSTILLFLGTACGLILVRKYVPEIDWRPTHFRLGQLKRMRRFSLGMFYIAVLGLLISQVDSLIIGRVLSMTAVASYSIAVKLFGVIRSVIKLLMVAVEPAAYNISAAQDKLKLEKLIHTGVYYRSLITVPLCFGAILIAPAFIRLWVGEAYEPVIIWAQVRCIAPLFTSLGVANSVCRSAGHVRSSNIVFSCSILFNFGLSLWLVHHFGIGGPILGTVIAVILIGDFFMFPIFCRILGVEWKKTFFMTLRILLAGFVVFIAGYFLRNLFVFDRFFTLIVYTALVGGLYVLTFGSVFMRKEIIGFIHDYKKS